MKEKALQTGPTMVRIDGGLVRRLREERGLTQLYLATSVGVTTDTISRWENRHYQSVKIENAQRLADALEVELAGILDSRQENGPCSVEAEDSPSPLEQAWKAKKFFLPLVAFCVVAGIWGFFVFRGDSPQPDLLGATRKAPAHAMTGYPFPVVITVWTASPPLSVVVKESLPANVQAVASSAGLSSEGKAQLKWIVKDTGSTQRFGYMVTPIGPENLRFHGTITGRVGGDREVVIGGSQSLAIAPFHWADSDQDGVISDDEILAVYDDFEDVSGLSVDVELVDEIWMGSGYRWSREKAEFEVIP